MATSRLCSIVGCGKHRHTAGLCGHHFKLTSGYKPTICSVDGCSKPAHRAGMCSAHSKRLYRNGSTESIISPKNAKLEWLRESLSYESDACLFFPYKCNSYGRAQFFLNRKAIFASVWVCEQTHGPRPSTRHEAAHSCGNGHLSCVNKRHIRWATFEENKADMVEHGTAPRGERMWSHKVTELQVREIRSLKGVMSEREIAKLYGVTRGCISGIHRKLTWFWLE